MRNRKSGLVRAISSLALVGLIAVGAAALMTESANAKPKKPPGPLCGPDILWECTFRDGSTELVGATRCDIEKFEKKNKATCVPASG